MKEKLIGAFNNVKNFTSKNSPTILTGLGVAGVFGTAFMAFKAGPRAKEIIDEHKKDMSLVKRGDKEAKRAVTIETAKKLAPVVLPATAMGIASSACIIGANTISGKRVAVLSAAYSLAESNLKDYQNKVTEMIGEKKTAQIRDAVSKEKLDANPVKSNTEIVMTGDGDVLCMDSYSGRYFRSNAQRIGQAINELSSRVRNEMYISLNEFYDEINIDRIPMGDDFGWNVDDIDRGNLPIYYSALLTKDNQPCLVIDYDIFPRMDFRNLH